MRSLAHFVFVISLLVVYCWPRPFGVFANDEFTYLFTASRLVDHHTVFYTNEPMQRYRDPAFAPHWYIPVSETLSAPKYYPGFPLILSIFYVFGGTRAMEYANAVLGLLGLWLVYQLGTLLFSRSAGWIAVLLLAFNPMYLTMVYKTMSHMTATICLLLSLWCWFTPSERKSRLLGWCSGLLIGYAVFTRRM